MNACSRTITGLDSNEPYVGFLDPSPTAALTGAIASQKPVIFRITKQINTIIATVTSLIAKVEKILLSLPQKWETFSAIQVELADVNPFQWLAGPRCPGP